MFRSTPHIRVLARALANCGGEAGLAKALGVSAESLSHWLAGHEVPPANVYFRALDLVTPKRPLKPAR